MFKLVLAQRLGELPSKRPSREERGRDVRADRLEPPGVRPEPIPPERHAGIRTVVVVIPARIVLPAEKVVRAEVVR